MSLRKAGGWTTFVIAFLILIWAVGSLPTVEVPPFALGQPANSEQTKTERYAIPKGTFPRSIERAADRLIRGVERISDFIDANHEVVETLSTVFVALFTFTLWQSTKDLWKAGERQIELIRANSEAQAVQTNKSLAHAAAQVEKIQGWINATLEASIAAKQIAVLDRRAWIAVETAIRDIIIQDNGLVQVSADITVRNVGRVPAFSTVVNFEVFTGLVINDETRKVERCKFNSAEEAIDCSIAISRNENLVGRFGQVILPGEKHSELHVRAAGYWNRETVTFLAYGLASYKIDGLDEHRTTVTTRDVVCREEHGVVKILGNHRGPGSRAT